MEGDSIVCSLSGEVLATLPTDAQPFQLPAAQATTKRRARYPDLRELEASFGTKNPVPVDESGNAIYPDIDVDAQAVEVDDE